MLAFNKSEDPRKRQPDSQLQIPPSSTCLLLLTMDFSCSYFLIFKRGKKNFTHILFS